MCVVQFIRAMSWAFFDEVGHFVAPAVEDGGVVGEVADGIDHLARNGERLLGALRPGGAVG